MFYCEFPEIFKGKFFAGYLQTATSKCSLLHDFSEKKNVILKATTTVNQKETCVYP